MTPLTDYQPKWIVAAMNIVSIPPLHSMTPLTSYELKCNEVAVYICNREEKMVSVHPPPPANVMTPLTYYGPKCNREAVGMCNREEVNMVSIHVPPPAITPLTFYGSKYNRQAVNMGSSEYGENASTTPCNNSTHMLWTKVQ
ncbi:hypothetical protein F5141DRAFT_1066115 [Pisolithus sp. B1]|nr:hypothetical protein F5141DRAFT_1066115 [Pisolithus sp. B1]